MTGQLLHYVLKLAAEGIALPGRAALLAWNDEIEGEGADDLMVLGAALLQRLPTAAALAVVEPATPFARFLIERLAPEHDRVVPRDIETRTFLHDIPVVRRTAANLDLDTIVRLLGERRGVLVEGVGIVALGGVTVEQAYVNASSIFHAVYVKYLLDILTVGPLSAEEAVAFALFRQESGEFPTADGLAFRPGPLAEAEAEEAVAEMIRVGRYTVERRLVDSCFGNISCRIGDDILISQTASSLDALDGCIDPIPFDDSTTLGLTASSELLAHRRIYEVTAARTILHGHPRFSVVLSMLCADEATCSVTDCWRSCPHVRYLGGAPVVAGEIGAGGLARRVPPVIGADGRAIVYGHGVFAIGTSGFEAPFRALVETEQWCRSEYFRRFDAGLPFG